MNPAIRLDSNENPLGPSPLALEAARRALGESNRYPDAASGPLRARLAEYLKAPGENFVFGCGSTELILLAPQALVGEADEGIVPAGTFPMYAIGIHEAGARLVEVPLRDHAIDLDAMATAVTARTRILYVANPNNPTGTLFTAAVFERFLDRIPGHVLVVLDEAYFHYAERPGYSRSIELVREGRNLLVLRTFSKVYGLAGFRIGFGVAPPAIIAAFDRVRAPFNTSLVAQAAALAALGDENHVRRSLDTNRAGMAQLERGLGAMGIGFVPSAGNFILVHAGGNGRAVADALLARGVVVRPMGGWGFPQAIRVSAGLAEENQEFLAALGSVLGRRRGVARGERESIAGKEG